MTIGAAIKPGNVIGIWRVGAAIQQTDRNQFYLAQSADSKGSNRWPYVIRIADERFRWSVQNYLAVAGGVQHPGLVTVVDGSADSSVPYLVMPRLTTDQSGAITAALPVVLWAARQVAESLAAMHRGGWVHGDVRPGHVLGNRMGHAMLIDLGSAAKVHSARATALSLDREFASPEAMRGDHAAVPAMDIFSLGRTLWSWILGVQANQSDLTPVAQLIEAMLSPQAEDRPTTIEVVDQLSQLELKSLERSIAPNAQQRSRISPSQKAA